MFKAVQPIAAVPWCGIQPENRSEVLEGPLYKNIAEYSAKQCFFEDTTQMDKQDLKMLGPLVFQ